MKDKYSFFTIENRTFISKIFAIASLPEMTKMAVIPNKKVVPEQPGTTLYYDITIVNGITIPFACSRT